MSLPNIPPLVRISLGLVFITISIVLGADMVIGVNPEYDRIVLDSRKKVTESMAVQTTILANAQNIDTARDVFEAVVERNDDLLSVAVRKTDGSFVAQAGDHELHWGEGPKEGSTPTHTRVNIFRGGESWGVLEMRFASLPGSGPFGGWTVLTKFLIFIAVTGFAGYLLFMKRTLRHLDPTSVIPDRVKATLDVLSEGVVLVDPKERIVLANEKFAEMVYGSREELIGRGLSGLPWRQADNDDQQDLPWLGVLKDGEPRTGTSLSLPGENKDEKRTYVVNSAPILDDKGEARGVLATFDDVSEVERQNVELEKLLNERKEAEKEIRRQNERLEYLATRDPLTDCLNRRALFEKFDQEIGHARDTDAPLACIMTDIDHFKSVNDTFGHSVGDDVIRLFADTLRACLRSIDIIGRYGGEEFCIVLPGLDLERAAQAAERIRAAIEREGVSALPPDAGRTLTSSFGVSLWHVTDKSGDDTVQRADEALYASKTGGRNRVTRTDELPSTATLTA